MTWEIFPYYSGMLSRCQVPPSAAAASTFTLPIAATAAALGLLANGGAALATLLILAPLTEEIVFRAGLQEALLRRPGTAPYANGATALAFAAAHVALRPGLWSGLTLLPALLIGALYGRRCRLGGCVALHAALNAAWLLGTHLHA